MKSNKYTPNFDLRKFEKIEDLIYLDEPILTHLRLNGKHYLLNLVETLKSSDIFLMFEVLEEEIYEYLTKRTSLRKLITRNQNMIYVIEQDFEGKIINTDITQSEFLDSEYLPHSKSFLDYEPSYDSYYYNFIKDFESQAYLLSLREDAFYLKFAPTNDKYSDTIGFNELVNNLLKNVSSSFKSFLKADFFCSFKEIKTDTRKLQSIFSKLSQDLDYRMVDLKFGSFEVGLAVDKVMKNSIENSRVKEWAIGVGYKYKNLVLDEDYDRETVDEILETYSEDERKKIFDPIFQITESPNFKLQVKTSKNKEYSTIKLKDKSVISKIVPPKLKTQMLANDKEYEIVQVTTVVEKNKINKSIKLGENTLFDSTDTTQVMLTNKNFEKFGYKLNFKIELPLNISTQRNLIIVSTQFEGIDFEKTIFSGKMDDGIDQITSAIYEYILNKTE
jgi:hypothetical protein